MLNNAPCFLLTELNFIFKLLYELYGHLKIITTDVKRDNFYRPNTIAGDIMIINHYVPAEIYRRHKE